MEHTLQFRRTYQAAVPHTLFTALVWLMSAFITHFMSMAMGYTFFIVAATFTFPAGELIRKMMKAPQLVSKDNQLPFLFMLMAFGIPLCYPLIYLACKDHPNLFFAAFSILVGAHYLPFAYGYGMKSFIVLGLLLVFQGTACAFLLPDFTIMPAIFTGVILIIFAALHYNIIKNENL